MARSATSAARAETVTARRAAIVTGVRTPFLKAGTDSAQVGGLELRTAGTRALLPRSGISPTDVDEVMCGDGTLAAGVSRPLTDVAATLPLMSTDKAAALGLTPKALVRSYAYAAVDPAGQLLIGPAYAIPKALERAGVELSDVDLVEMHEAF